MDTSTSPAGPPAGLDLRGMVGPLVTTSAYRALQRLPTGALLVILTDDPPSPAVLVELARDFDGRAAVESLGSRLWRITVTMRR